MKKVYQFIRSMQFGMILLGLVMAVSAAGSVIPQNNEPMYYVMNYPNQYRLIFSLQLNRVFTSWYFAVLIILLCINLTMCSVVRFQRVSQENVVASAFKAADGEVYSEEDLQRIRAELERMHCQKQTDGSTEVYYKNLFGRYGTFLVHLGILLTVIFFALGMVMPKILDESCYPKESIILEDGTEIYVDDFSIEDETGSLDYKSVVNIKLPDGRESGLKEVSVNHPVKEGQYKVYQQTYGTIGKVTVEDQEGHQDSFLVESKDFLSADGKNGILIDNLYPGLQETEDGTQLITSTMGRYENPVYVFMVMDEGSQETMLAFPGDSLDLAGYTFFFEQPVEYPGLRIKKSPAYVNLCLLLSVLVLTAGLGMTFLMTPVVVTVKENNCRINGSKTEGLRLCFAALLRKDMKGDIKDE